MVNVCTVQLVCVHVINSGNQMSIKINHITNNSMQYKYDRALLLLGLLHSLSRRCFLDWLLSAKDLLLTDHLHWQ